MTYGSTVHDPTGRWDSNTRTLAQITVREAVRRLSAPPVPNRHALRVAQSRARVVESLHVALDRTLAATPLPVPGP